MIDFQPFYNCITSHDLALLGDTLQCVTFILLLLALMLPDSK